MSNAQNQSSGIGHSADQDISPLGNCHTNLANIVCAGHFAIIFIDNFAETGDSDGRLGSDTGLFTVITFAGDTTQDVVPEPSARMLAPTDCWP